MRRWMWPTFPLWGKIVTRKIPIEGAVLFEFILWLEDCNLYLRFRNMSHTIYVTRIILRPLSVFFGLQFFLTMEKSVTFTGACANDLASMIYFLIICPLIVLLLVIVLLSVLLFFDYGTFKRFCTIWSFSRLFIIQFIKLIITTRTIPL
jgi:hypothetical protein